MRAGCLYRHPRCLDIDLEIVKIQYLGPDYIKARVRYWHRTGKYFISLTPETVKIQRVDLPKWREVADRVPQ